MKALDHIFFGNGYGTSSPYFDHAYYWLVDTINGRESGKGQLYMSSGWFGCQLASWQWRHPVPGERRRLVGRDFVVWRSERRWIRVMVYWAMVGFPNGIDEGNAAIRKLRDDLNEGVIGP